MRRRLVVAGAVLALAAGAGALAWTRRLGNDPFPEDRVASFNAHLRQVAGPYRLLIGDSQAERFHLPALCGEPVVDAGVAGLRAGGVRRVVEALATPRPAAAAVVMIGTNDLALRRRPADAASRSAFRGEVRALLEGLRTRADRVFAVPPPALDGARVGRAFDAAERAPYAAILAEECARTGCRLADVLPADPSRSPDGVHVADEAYAEVAARLAELVCTR